MIIEDRAAILEEEVYILKDSGEIPEIAYHSTLYYLTEDEQGPQMLLSPEELALLQDAALHRYREIVLRDLNVAHRDLGMYRGIRRTLYNWQRMQDFCQRIGRDCVFMKPVIRSALLDFLGQELKDVHNGIRRSCVNCSTDNILQLAASLDLNEESLPPGWQNLCCQNLGC